MYDRAMATPARKTVEKKERINLRLDEEDRRLFGKAAAEERETLTQFLVVAGRERAERALADRTEFQLDDDRWQAIAAAMDRPAEVKPELIELLARQRPE